MAILMAILVAVSVAIFFPVYHVKVVTPAPQCASVALLVAKEAELAEMKAKYEMKCSQLYWMAHNVKKYAGKNIICHDEFIPIPYLDNGSYCKQNKLKVLYNF